MDLPIVWLAIILVGLILLSAFFSGSETSMMASNRHRLKSLAKTNNRAKLTLKLLDNIDNLIGTILLGNNFVNIFAASIATILAIKLFGEESIAFASIALTFVILVFAENTPKTFAAKHPEKLANFSAPILNIFVKVLYPLVWIIKGITRIILLLFGIKNDQRDDTVSADELRMNVIDAKANISDKYHKILLNIIDLQEVKIEDIMIPKTEFISVDIQNLADVKQVLKQTSHTRILVYTKYKENIIGILHMRKVVNLYARNKFSLDDIKNIMVKPYFVPEGISLATQLEQFQKNKKRLAIVVDEYGNAKGMIVLEDILEEIVGQFTSNSGEAIKEFSKQADGSYLIDPSINLYKLKNELNINFDTNAKTLNGLILDNLQDVPKRDLSIKINNVIIEIKQISDEVIKLVSLRVLTDKDIK